MSSSEAPAGQQKYYDPIEVEAYVREVTNAIRTLQGRLQDATRRAEAAERATGGQHPETASLGRALLLAGEVADKTIADADARAGEIIRAAEERALTIIDAANTEAQRVVDTAGATAADVFQKGEARLLAAVRAFTEGSSVLSAALARIENDATSWRSSLRSASRADQNTTVAPGDVGWPGPAGDGWAGNGGQPAERRATPSGSDGGVRAPQRSPAPPPPATPLRVATPPGEAHEASPWGLT